MSILMKNAICLYFSMQEENILEQSNAMCYSCTLQSTCTPLFNIRHARHNAIEHTHAKIPVSAVECQES